MRNVYLLLFSLCISFSVTAQKKAEAALKVIDDQFPQEKIHLFFNKENYVAGETIWFKAYVFSGYVQSNISTNMYVELYNDKKELIDKVQLPLLNAVGEGGLKLNGLVPEGIYYVRAYTKWMMNFDKKFEYLNELIVYNPLSDKSVVAKTGKWSVTAFPESGTLLAEEENTVAVRLHSNAALPQKWQGYITEDKDTTKKIVSFQSLNPQMASVTFIPAKGKNYIFHCTDEANNKSATLLKPVASGVLLKAIQSGNKIHATLIFKGLPNGGLNYKLLAHMQGQLIYSSTIRNTDAMIVSGIPVDKLMNGVVHITLFNENEIPVAERLLYVTVDKPANILLETGDLSNKARALNQWQVEVDSARFFNYAFSVSDAAIGGTRKRNIFSDLWLGDFSTDIYNPGWYFSSADAEKKKALDALLITEKWSRFTWPDLLNNNMPVIKELPEKYLSYTGTATKKGVPMAEELVNLLFRYQDSTNQVVQVKTDKEGKFSVINTVFFDTVKVFFQPNQAKVNAKDIAIQFEMKNRFFPFTGSLPVSSYTLADRKQGQQLPLIVTRESTTLKNQVKLDTKFKELEDVRVEAKIKSEKEKLDKKLSSDLFQVDNAQTFDFVNEEQLAGAYGNIFDWLQGRVAGLTFEIQNDENGSLTSAGQKIPVIRGGEVALFLDEMRTDLDAIYSIPTSEVAMVKVIKGYFVGTGGGGTIAVYTKKAKARTITKSYLATGMMYGYRQSPSYTHFDYGGISEKIITEDNRNQLYWNSNLAAKGKEDKAMINFYNNDVASEYIITVTGFTKDAKPVFLEKIIKAGE